MKFMRFAWRWSWIVTLPLVVFFVNWGTNTWRRYSDFGVRHSVVERFSLRNVGKLEFDQLTRFMNLNGQASRAKIQADKSVPMVALFAKESNLRKLDSNLPHSGFKMVKGAMFYDGQLMKVQLRYRGDNVYHWGYFKKSIRVRTSKDRLFDGLREFNLIAPRSPEILNNYASYRLASRMGLIAPKTDLVNVVINGRLEGLYILTEQLSETTLRRHGFMPGDLYSGELIMRDAYQGIQNHLFRYPRLWRKAAANNHFPLESKKPLEELVRILRKPLSAERQARLESMVDMAAFGRFNALEILLGTAHIDNIHNWRLFWDPARSCFVPVVWDPVGWHVTTRGYHPSKQTPPSAVARLDVVTSDLHVALHQHQGFLLTRHAALRDFFESGLDEVFLGSLDDTMKRITPSIERDPNLATDVAVIHPPDVQREMRELHRYVTAHFAEVRSAYLGSPPVTLYSEIAGSPHTYGFGIHGRNPLDRLTFRFRAPLDKAVRCEISHRRNGSKVTVDVSGALRQTGNDLVLDYPLLAKHTLEIKSMSPGAVIQNRAKIEFAYYELKFVGLEDAELFEVLGSSGSDEPKPIRKAPHLPPQDFSNTFGVAPAKPNSRPIVWSGKVRIDGVLRPDRELIIQPGTTIQLAPDASIVASARVIALGTAQEPIRFEPMNEGQRPWGVVALQGQGTNGSRFAFCEFKDGSGFAGTLFEYSGMFSLHDSLNAEFESCVFRRSQVVDDMVHGIHCEVSFKKCLFADARADALDLDISEAYVEGCVFIRSGNDALDLMTTRAVVRDCTMDDSGDKGISVGEGSRLFAVNNLFKRCNIAVQSKDDSAAALHNCDFFDNKPKPQSPEPGEIIRENVGCVDAYKKNWRYDGGGRVFLYNCRLRGSPRTLTADSRSNIWVHDSAIEGAIEPADSPRKRRVLVHSSVDAKMDGPARVPNLFRYPEDSAKLGTLGETYWKFARSGHRGSTLKE